MKCKRLMGLAGAAAMACTSVPLPPVTAADLPVFEVDANGNYWRTVNNSESGEAGLTRKANALFAASWDSAADIEYGVGYVPDAPLDWKQNSVQYQFSSLFELNGSALIGVSGVFADSDDTFYVIDGWRGDRPEYPDKVGEVTVNIAAMPVVYDVYAITGDVVNDDGERVTVNEYWSVRQENTLSDLTNGAGYQVDLSKQLSSWEQLGLECGQIRQVGAYFHVGDGRDEDASGTLDAKVNQLIVSDPAPASGDLNETGLVTNGMTWEHWQSSRVGKSDMSVAADGGFSAEWSGVEESVYQVGSYLDEVAPPDDYETLKYSYQGKAKLAAQDSFGVMAQYTRDKYLQAYIWITEGYAGSAAEGKNKVGTYELDGHTYRLSYTPGQGSITGNVSPTNYFCVRTDGELTAGEEVEIEGTIDLIAHKEKWNELGQAFLTPSYCGLYANAFGHDADAGTGKISFTKNKLDRDAVFTSAFTSQDLTDDGYIHHWYVEGTSPEIVYDHDGAFEGSWTKNGTFEYRVGQNIPEPAELAEPVDLTYFYEGTVDLRGNVCAGVVCTFEDPDTTLYIIDAYGSGLLPALKKTRLVKSFEIDNVSYDLYENLNGKNKPEYWCIATESQAEAVENAKIYKFLNFADFYEEMNGLEPNLEFGKIKGFDFVLCSYQSDGSVKMGNGGPGGKTLYPDQDFTHQNVTPDGYAFSLHGEIPYDRVALTVDSDGVHETEFRNVKKAYSVVGKKLSQPVDWKAYKSFALSYQATAKLEGDGWVGVTGIAQDNNTTVLFDIVDGWSGDKPYQNMTAVGTIEIDGAEYDVYRDCLSGLCVPMTGPIVYHYYSVRKDNLLSDDAENPMENYVLLNSHFAEWEKLGMKVPALHSAGVVCEMGSNDAEPQNSAQFNVTVNRTIAVKESYAADKTLKGLFADAFRIGAVASVQSGDQRVKASDFMKQNLDFAAEYNTLDSNMLLRRLPDSEAGFEVVLSKYDPNLKFCEENHLPVRFGSFVNSRTPEWFMRDKDGAYATPAVMNARLEKLIQDTFAQIKEYYPDLEVFAVDVCEGLLDDEGKILVSDTATGRTNRWAYIYGKDSTEYICNAFKYARKYAPKSAMLYLTDYNLFLEAKADGFAELAMKLQKEELIDGVGLEGVIPFYGNNASTLKGFERGIQKLASIGGLDVQITDLWVSMSEIYFDSHRCACYAELFEILVRNADLISCVTMEDYGGGLDGPHWLKDINLAGYLADHAEIFSESMTTREPFPFKEEEQTSRIEISAPGRPEVKTTASGDANCDGAMDISDVVLTARVVNEDKKAKITDAGMRNADVDNNGNVNLDDVSKMLRVIARIETL